VLKEQKMSFSTKEFAFKFDSRTAMLMHADDVEAADRLKEWRKDPSNNELSVAGDDRSPPWTWRTYIYAGDIDGQKQIVIPQSNIMAALKYAGSQMTLKGNKTFKKLSQSGIAIGEEFCALRVGLGDAKDAPAIDGAYCQSLGLIPNEDEVVKNDAPATFANVAKRHAEELGVSVGDSHPGYGLRPVLASDIDEIPDMMKYRDQVNQCRRLGFNLFSKRAPVNKSKHVRCRPRFEKWEVTGTLRVTQEAIDDRILKQMLTIAGEQSGLGDWRPSSPMSPGPFGQFSVELTEI
jgi:hypothetical protein